MSLVRKLDFLTFGLPAYALGALAGFGLGIYLLHWAAGLFLAVLVVLGLRALDPLFDRLLGRGASK